MARRWMVIAACAVLLSAAKGGGTSADLAALHWMSGDWLVARGDSWTEERWSAPRGGVMLGTSLSGKGGKASGYEFMRIAVDPDGTLAFWGSPGGKPPVSFRLVSMTANEVAFENPKHDFPTRIAYRRTGDIMTATISGAGGKNAESWVYRRSR